MPRKPRDMRKPEHLIPLVMTIARKDLGIRIRPSDVSWTEREIGGGAKAPILVKYFQLLSLEHLYHSFI